MNENYRALLEAAFPSTIVRSWYMLPTSEKLSHSFLARLIVLNKSLTMDERIKCLEILKAECKDLYVDAELIPLIENEINEKVELYHEFIKPGPRIFYRSEAAVNCFTSSLDKIIKISQENKWFDSISYTITRSYIDAKDYEDEIMGIYNKSGKILDIYEDPESSYFRFLDKPGILSYQNKLIIPNYFRPGDAVFNILTKKTGTVQSVLNSYIAVKENNTESSEDTKLWYIPEIEYDI